MAQGPAKVDFQRDIRPILSENCFQCHGPDANHREGDLRLDQHEQALQVIKPGDHSQSELFVRISTKDADLVMPPVDSNRKLTPQQIELLSRWIDAGADWGQHWSWTPIQAPAIPDVTATENATIENPIDAFIQAELQRQKLRPADKANRATLIRRLTLDLTGLPPTPEDVQAFLSDDSSNAYEKVVDRLLASSTYGERMAWDWLDAARYADSNGYQGDMERTMWPWRDWVVQAFNENLPYDEFTIWQLAGDLLPEATFEQKLATGFCRNHMINGEGGRIPEENRVDYVMDMVETTGTLWMGLTLNCCRCHDHKFDQLSQKDYYSMFAFFNQTPVTGGGRDPKTPPILAAPTPEQQLAIDKAEAELTAAKSAVAERAKSLLADQMAWEKAKLEQLQTGQTWNVLTADLLHAQHQMLEQLDDQSIFASGTNPDNDTYTVTAELGLSKITGLRLDALRHESHFQGGLARSNSGNFVLTEIEIALVVAEETRPIKIESAEATFEQGDLKVTKAYDGNAKTGWAVYAGKPIDRDHAAVFRFDSPVEVPENAKLQVTLRHDSQHINHNIGRFRLAVTDQESPKLDDNAHQALLLALLTPLEKRSNEQQKQIREAHLAEDQKYKQLSEKIKRAEGRLSSARGKVAQVMVMQDMPEPRQTSMLDRGLYTEPGEEVSANVPESLPNLPEEATRDRLALANWLISDDNPLTARVVVNRFWQQFFGIGLVKTANDFGVQGEIPVHQDLLNWLAADFRDSSWDVKRFVKQLVMSHTYRQSSRLTPELYEADPENRLLARAPRYRLPSWMIRDQVLAISGLLTKSMGGPSVNVYQPEGIWEEATFGKKTYKQDHGEALYRRSLYVFWRRIIGPTIFFDNASRQNCTVKVFRTNTPLHSLRTLNDITYVEAARVLAEQLLDSTERTDLERLNIVFQRSLARDASQQEAEILLAGLSRSRAEYAADPAAAKALLEVGEAPRNEICNMIDHASWTALCLAVFNFDETLTKE